MGGKPPPKSGNPPSPKSGMSPPNLPNLKGFLPRWLPDVVTLRVRSSIVILSLHLMPRHPSPVATMLRVPLPERRILSFAQMTADLLLAVSLQAVRVSVFSVPLAASISTFFLFFSQRGAPSWLVRSSLFSFTFALPSVLRMSCPSLLLPLTATVSLCA